MSGEGGTCCEVELVTCTLSELSSCLCLNDASKIVGSGRRKQISDCVDVPPEDIFLSARRTVWTNKPTLIDRLIFWHRAALAMGPKKVRTTVNSTPTTISGVKRKRNAEGSPSSASLQPKKRPHLQVKKEAGLNRKIAGKSVVKGGMKKNLGNDQGTNRYATRISQNKVRIPFSLRSGRKMADILKKKRLRAKKDAGSPSNVDTSEACKTDESKATKKEANPVKKNLNVPVRKENSALLKTSVHPQNKTVAKSKMKVDNSAIVKMDDNLLKKKRRKRKRCSMWSNKTRKVRKKDTEAGEVEEVEGSSEGEEEEDDDETGIMSDVSLLSTATLDSSLSLAPSVSVKQEKPTTDDCSFGTIKAEEDMIKSEDIKVEVDKETEYLTTDESNAFCNDQNDAIYEKSSTPVDLDGVSVSTETVNCSNTNVQCSLLDEANSVAKKGEITTDPGVSPTVKSNVMPTLEPIISEPQMSELLIEKCESLSEITPLPIVNYPSDTKEIMVDLECIEDVNSITESKCDFTSLNESTNIPNLQRTEVPEQVPFKNDKGATVDDAEAVVTENESELKRDADSTTCDNPRGMDDSYGDLSLYVSEDDLTGSSKEHNEELPDSTNISQGEHCVADDEARLSPSLKVEEKASAQFSETETIVEAPEISEEQKQMKESVLHALGLKSLSNISNETLEEKPPKRSDGYTGTLKAVIKLNRTGDKKHMVYKRAESALASSDKLEYRICSEVGPEESKKLSHEHIEESEDDGTNEDGSNKESKLIIPEKSSSFSIHPGRLCSDVCSYCFGKFGSLDTPCHVAQLKGEERQKKILENEPHLTGESCLCDACYRYVDRKANFPEKLKVGRLKPPAQASICCVTHCSEPATRTIKRKWLIKLKKSITNKLNIDMEKLGHGVYYPFCTQHHYWVEYFTICGICRKRLNRNNLFSLGAEADRLNLMLAEDGIPARLSVNLFLCKLCRYYADLRLKYPDPSLIPSSNQNFYKNYRRKILMSLDIPVSDSDDELLNPPDEPKKNLENNCDDKADEDVMSLSGLATLLGEQPQQQARIQVKFGNVNIGTLSNLNIGQQGGSTSSTVAAPTVASATSAGINGSSRHKNEPTYPEVSLTANFEYQGPNTPDGSWEKYQSTLQFDKKTKQLWTELQRPYGSQTSFLRHLVMLERVWRDGYLILAPDSDEAASRYITSARNRIRAFETQGPKMSTQATTAPTISVQTTSTSTCSPVTRPTPSISVGRKPPSAGQTFPFLTNTGEIEVTPIRSKASPIIQQQLQQQPLSVISKSLSQPVAITVSSEGPKGGGGASQFSGNSMHKQFNQKTAQSRKITPLDRAKSLVRMAPIYQQIQQHPQSGVERRGYPSPVRYMGAPHSVGSIPPLVRLPQTQPTQYYQPPMSQQSQIRLTSQQQIQQHINMQQQSYFLSQQPQAQQRMSLPKLPRQLTVMSMPPRPSLPQAITLSHSGITIEKQIAPSRTSSLPIERPSISVFREPATP